MFNPFRLAAPPEDGTALYISPGHYQVSIWIVFGIIFDGKTSVDIKHQPFDSEREASIAAVEWEKSKLYNKVYYKHCGVMDINLPVDDNGKNVGMKRSALKFW